MNLGYDPRAVIEAGERVKAGGWFWWPLLFGLTFLAAGVACFVAATTADDAGTLIATGGPFTVVGVGAIVVAFVVRRDFARPRPAPRVRHAPDAAPAAPVPPTSYWHDRP